MANTDEEYDYTGAPDETQRDYLADYPATVTMWAPSDYANEFGMARGHTYALEDMINIDRAKPSAACFSCKSAQYILMEREMGADWTSMPFDEGLDHIDMTISCYDCHENQPGVIHVNRTNMVDAVEEYDLDVPEKILACAQCHNDYFFEKDTKAVKNPWKYGVDPDSVLKHYNEIWYVDFENETSGAPMIKVQHPEFETFTGSIHAQQGLACSDCHMAPENGYSSHQWTSPFRSDTTMQQTCLSCHSKETVDSLEQRVETIQTETQDRMRSQSEAYEALHERIGQHKDDMPADVRDEVYRIIRDGQFYWDYVFVENSDGFHNSGLTRDTLDKAQMKLDEANELLDRSGF